MPDASEGTWFSLKFDHLGRKSTTGALFLCPLAVDDLSFSKKIGRETLNE
jgi:hypothetical protein